jgi:hypothetical protein
MSDLIIKRFTSSRSCFAYGNKLLARGNVCRRREFELLLQKFVTMLQSALVLDPGSALHMVSATDFHTLTDASQQ